MFTKLGYFARETAISLRRNLLMTIAGVLTVTVSLFLLGGVLLLSTMVDHGVARWQGDVDMQIYMQPDATQSQIDDIGAALDQLSQGDFAEVDRYVFLDKAAAYEEFKMLFAGQPQFVENLSDPNVLPTSFKVVPTGAQVTAELRQTFVGRPGVRDVLTPDSAVRFLIELRSNVRLLFFGIAAVLLASSLFLIVNTIRLAIFARRREIQVMKLVGATNWFIRIPFMLEGLVEGVLGALLAFGGVLGLQKVLSNQVADANDLFSAFYVTFSDALGIGWSVLALGAIIGMVGSAIGLRRFLEV
jgi:cell division transport system permease protein